MVFHIGTDSVGAGIIVSRKGKLPEVLYTVREHIPYRENLDPERFVTDMHAALKSANADLVKQVAALIKHRGHDVERVFYVFSSPWATTQTKTFGMRAKKDFVVEKKHIDRLIALHEDSPGGMKVVERSIVAIKIDGHHTSTPYGQEARSIGVSLLTTLMPESLYNRVMEISSRGRHPHSTIASSFAPVSFSAIRDAYHKENDFIFLDVGGEVSDITVVCDGSIAETASFPMGRHSIIRKVRESLKSSAEEAASLVKTYEEGHLDKSLEEKLGHTIDQAAVEWLDGFHVALGKVTGSAVLPKKIFAIVDNDLQKTFVRTLRSEKVSFIPLSDDKLKHFADFDDDADKDPYIALIAAFADRVHHVV